MVVSEFSECDFRNVPAASEVIDSESFGLALGLPADCADARSSSWPSSSEQKFQTGFCDNIGNRQGYNGRHDRPVPTLVGAGMFGGPAVVMLRVAGRTRWW